MDRKKELQKYISDKQEALEFWSDLRDVMPLENKIALLKSELLKARAELEKINAKEAC